MRRMGAENKLMHTILVQGRSLFGRLQEAMPTGENTSPRVSVLCGDGYQPTGMSLNRRGSTLRACRGVCANCLPS